MPPVTCAFGALDVQVVISVDYKENYNIKEPVHRLVTTSFLVLLCAIIYLFYFICHTIIAKNKGKERKKGSGEET